jgi:hypothetical protein
VEDKSEPLGDAESSPEIASDVPVSEESSPGDAAPPTDRPMLFLGQTGAGPVGIGGWLLFFIIGQLACRPLKVLSDFGNSKTVDVSQIAQRFPLTARTIEIERVVMIFLLVFGIIVALALLRMHDSRPVTLAKLYLITNAVSTLVLALLYLTTDLPDTSRTQLIVQGFLNFGLVSTVSAIWFLYFTRSRRVHATYLQPKFSAEFTSTSGE